jgi:hypothetical protein
MVPLSHPISPFIDDHFPLSLRLRCPLSFFSSLVVKYKKGGIAIISYDYLLEFAKFYSYGGFS